MSGRNPAFPDCTGLFTGFIRFRGIWSRGFQGACERTRRTRPLLGAKLSLQGEDRRPSASPELRWRKAAIRSLYSLRCCLRPYWQGSNNSGNE